MNAFNFPLSSRKSAKIFLTALSCSQAMMTILDEALGIRDEISEMAAHPLAGGLLHLGWQCGMTWGASLSAGNYIHRKYGFSSASIEFVLVTSSKLVLSLSQKAGSHICREITQCDFKSFSGKIKYIFTGKGANCAKLVLSWAPQAYSLICSISLSLPDENPKVFNCCAVKLAQMLNAKQNEQLMVAGFSGGLGLSGGACGALATAIWLKTLNWLRKSNKKTDSFFMALRRELTQSGNFYPELKSIQKQFESLNKSYLCKDIVGRNFSSLDDHREFIASGGCSEVLSLLEKTFKQCQ